jgi:hypothetical protein
VGTGGTTYNRERDFYASRSCDVVGPPPAGLACPADFLGCTRPGLRRMADLFTIKGGNVPGSGGSIKDQ